jgi:hypothetical protein
MSFQLTEECRRKSQSIGINGNGLFLNVSEGKYTYVDT